MEISDASPVIYIPAYTVHLPCGPAGLKSHLSDISPVLYKLYNVMQARNCAPDALELQIAEGLLPCTHATAQAYFERIGEGAWDIVNNPATVST